MNRFLSVILTLAWALWLGGMVALVIFVMQLFPRTSDNAPPDVVATAATQRAVAVQVAPVLFRSFVNYQIIVGMIACAAGAILTLRTRQKLYATFTLLLVVALGAAVLVHRWTFQMEDLRAEGQSGGEEFKALHHRSTAAYQSEMVLVLIAGVGWTLTLSTRRKAEETAPA